MYLQCDTDIRNARRSQASVFTLHYHACLIDLTLRLRLDGYRLVRGTFLNTHRKQTVLNPSVCRSLFTNIYLVALSF